MELGTALGAAHDDAGAARANVGDAFREDAPAVSLLCAAARWVVAQDPLAEWPGEPLIAMAHCELDGVAALQKELKVCRALWSAHFDLLSQVTCRYVCKRHVTVRTHMPSELIRYCTPWM